MGRFVGAAPMLVELFNTPLRKAAVRSQIRGGMPSGRGNSQISWLHTRLNVVKRSARHVGIEPCADVSAQSLRPLGLLAAMVALAKRKIRIALLLACYRSTRS